MKVKSIGWVIYYWFMVLFLAMTIVSGGMHMGVYDVIGAFLLIVSLIGVDAYVREKRVLGKNVWQIFLALYILFSFFPLIREAVLFYTQENIAQIQTFYLELLVKYSGIVLLVPLWVGIYFYINEKKVWSYQ